MISRILLSSALALGMILALAPEAPGQGIQIGFGKHRHSHGSHKKSSKGFDVRVILGGGSHRHPQAHQHCDACRRWVPGHVQVVHERVWVPGCTRQVWVPPVYETRYDRCGNPIQVLRSPGHYRTVQDPGRWEMQARQIQHPGRWEYVCGH